MSDSTTATILLTGNVATRDFPEWIARHAQKLGISEVSIQELADGIEVRAKGSEEMLHALALGASLGPESVLVDRVAITTDTSSSPL